MISGTIKIWKNSEGWGFIQGDDGEDYFINIANVRTGQTIQINSRVKFDISLPFIKTFPDLRFNRPNIAFIAVDFPAPFGPKIATISPMFTLIVQELIISAPP